MNRINNIKNYTSLYSDNNIEIIRHCSIPYEYLLKNIEVWHKNLAEIILEPSTLYYYATSNPDSAAYKSILTNDNLSDVQDVLCNLIGDTDRFYEKYKKNSYYASLVDDMEDITELLRLADDVKIKIKNNNDLDKAKIEIHKKLCLDYCYGVFGEILFYKVIENVILNELVLSKVQFITAPMTNAHGSDGVFCDENGKLLYFGEAKFSHNLESGIRQAISSMKNIEERIDTDISLIITHKNDLKNRYPYIINRDMLKEYSKGIIIFLLHGEEFDDKNIIDIINKNKAKVDTMTNDKKVLIISFPISDKEKLKERITKEIKLYDKKYRS